MFRAVRRGKAVWVARGPGGRPQKEGATLAEALARLRAALPPGPAVTVGEWADRWLAGLSVKPATLKSYRKTLAHVRRHLGSVRLSDLTPTRVEAFAAALTRPRGPLHPNTVKKILAELHNLLSGAVRDGVIPRNPVALAKKPRRQRKEIDPFTADELARIVAACDTAPLAPVAFLAATGARLGEALALDVTDVDVAAGTVSITKTFDADVGTGSPKSANSVRTITAAAAMPALRLAAGGRRAGPVFVSGRGRRRVRMLVDYAWRRLLKRLGLRYRNVHQLRHSVASEMVGAGVPHANVGLYLGDAVGTIVATYVHPVKGVDPGEVMRRLLRGGGGK